jgi:cell wall-associated NlpC family hydrolase
MLLAACAGAPVFRDSPPPDSISDAAAGHALKMVGKPYRYGGATPEGFDCSGLVYYSYRQAGAALPRDTEAQRLGSHPVERASLRRGDLVFFDQEGKKNSHVGIYLGEGAFVHAPSSGKHVRRDRLDSPYWRRHLSETRRLAL